MPTDDDEHYAVTEKPFANLTVFDEESSFTLMEQDSSYQHVNTTALEQIKQESKRTIQDRSGNEIVYTLTTAPKISSFTNNISNASQFVANVGNSNYANIFDNSPIIQLESAISNNVVNDASNRTQSISCLETSVGAITTPTDNSIDHLKATCVAGNGASTSLGQQATIICLDPFIQSNVPKEVTNFNEENQMFLDNTSQVSFFILNHIMDSNVH